MPITIGTNIASMRGQRALGESTNKLTRVYERLSTGQRINRASDDAAGLSIADSLKSDNRVYTQALRNINDAISALSIADSALAALTDIVTRQIELSEQAANGIYTYEQRKVLDDEANSLVDESNRILESVNFNDIKLLEGGNEEIRIQAGYGLDESIAVNLGNEISHKTGLGTFSESVDIDFSSYTQGLDVGDFNNDGNMDIIQASESARASLMLGNGDGSFAAPSVVTGIGSDNEDIRSSDFNGDGNLDFVVVNHVTDQFSVALGNGDGTFQAETDYNSVSTNARSLSVGDLNNDDKDEVFVIDRTTNEISYSMNNGDGTFATRTIINSSIASREVEIGDFNNDGYADLLASGSGEVEIFWGDGQGNLSQGSSQEIVGIGSGARTGDFNRDGILDVVTNSFGTTGSSGIYVATGNGDGSFTNSNFYQVDNVNFDNIEIADTNNDGIDDISVILSTDRQIKNFESDGEGSFTEKNALNFSSTLAPSDLVAADFNNDGVLEFVAGEYTASNPGDGHIFFQNLDDSTKIAHSDLFTAESARESLDYFKSILTNIKFERGKIGSFQSRLEVATGSLNSTRENIAAAESQIRDADIASESANLIKNKLLQEAATSVLAQANQSPALAIQLLN